MSFLIIKNECNCIKTLTWTPRGALNCNLNSSYCFAINKYFSCGMKTTTKKLESPSSAYEFAVGLWSSTKPLLVQPFKY